MTKEAYIKELEWKLILKEKEIAMLKDKIRRLQEIATTKEANK